MNYHRIRIALAICTIAVSGNASAAGNGLPPLNPVLPGQPAYTAYCVGLLAGPGCNAYAPAAYLLAASAAGMLTRNTSVSTVPFQDQACVAQNAGKFAKLIDDIKKILTNQFIPANQFQKIAEGELRALRAEELALYRDISNTQNNRSLTLAQKTAALNALKVKLTAKQAQIKAKETEVAAKQQQTNNIALQLEDTYQTNGFATVRAALPTCDDATTQKLAIELSSQLIALKKAAVQ